MEAAGGEQQQGGLAGQSEGGAVAPHYVEALLVEVVEPLLLLLGVELAELLLEFLPEGGGVALGEEDGAVVFIALVLVGEAAWGERYRS